MEDSAFDKIGNFKLSRLKNTDLRLENRKLITEKCRNAYLGDYKNICTVLGRFNIYIDSRDRTIGMHLLTKGYWEIQITECIANHVARGMNVIDLGASYGYYTLLMAGLIGHESGHVYSFEANPFVYDMLADTIEVNPIKSRVKATNVAITDQNSPDFMSFNYRIDSTMNGHLDICKSKSEREQSITVNTNCLDNMIPTGTTIDFIKVDIEGAEYMFWKGSQRTREESPHLKILLEFNANRYPDSAGQFVQEIIDDGFSIKLIQKTSDQDCYLSKDELLSLPMDSHVMLLLEKQPV